MSELSDKPEKRYYKRLEEELPVQLKIAGEIIETTTQNISCGGMFLPNVCDKLEHHKELEAFITLPEAGKPVRLAGRVLRIEKNPCAAAIEFSGLYDDNHLEIDRYIKWKLLN